MMNIRKKALAAALFAALAMPAGLAPYMDSPSVAMAAPATKVKAADAFEVDLAKGENALFEASNGWTNGMPFNCFWHKENVELKDGHLTLIVDKSPNPEADKVPYSGGEYRSKATYGYGRYEVVMKARVYQDFDAGYARQLQKEADKIWAYLGKTKESVYRVDEGQESGSGPYNDDNDIQERLWMAAEMFRTTGDKKYENYLAANKAELLKAPGFFTWDNTLALAQFAYAMSQGADSSLQAQVKKVYLDYADLISDKISKDGFNCALAQDEYTWASTKNAMTQGDMLLMAYQLDQKPAYLEGALAQIHYMFGRNSLDKSFLTGAGTNPPEHPHNRIHESTGAYVPGLLVGGPNAVIGGDPDQTKYLESGHVPTAKSYLDVLSSWSTNEYAIDYTGTAAYALAWFAKADPGITAAQLKLKRQFPSITK